MASKARANVVKRMDISGDWNRGYGLAATAKSLEYWLPDRASQNGVKDAEKQLGRKAAG